MHIHITYTLPGFSPIFEFPLALPEGTYSPEPYVGSPDVEPPDVEPPDVEPPDMEPITVSEGVGAGVGD